ncbi:MAG: hypothetical protein RBG1_1C00001G0860 [candidate division Zixibacteria bacterium RBG-1]|nr:MAG: hypothetical protein RBG1_1C00001G0860 [candidate division Zixibacteria bacterium RBG-1]OGC83634.1 MAG: hypothetical protein A2V73_03355 [candidate division Zixibacteria bacterium RBG_19FT_COMBO_42_43]
MDRRILFLILAVFTVSWAAILIKLCSAPPLVIAFYRMFIASVILCPLVFLKHFSALKQLLAEAPKLAILSGIFLGLHFAFWVTSLFYTSVSSSVVIVATQPVFVALFSLIFLKEKATLLVWLGIILALFGVAIIGGGDFANLKGDLLALLGAIMAAGYLTLGRNIRKKYDLIPYIFVAYFVSSIVLAFFIIILGDSFSPLTLKNFAWFILLAIIPTLIGHSLYNWLLKYVKAYLVGISILGEPIGASIWAFLIFKEVPRTSLYLGAVLIILGVILALTGERRQKNS